MEYEDHIDSITDEENDDFSNDNLFNIASWEADSSVRKLINLGIRNCIYQGEGNEHSINDFLTRYPLIKICGTSGISYKTIIADFYEQSSPHLGS